LKIHNKKQIIIMTEVALAATPTLDEELRDVDDVLANTPVDVMTSSSVKSGVDSLAEKDELSQGSKASSSKFSMDESSELDELLQSGHLQGGCFGLLERLPLFVKMFLMLVISLVGILAIGIVLTVTEGQAIAKAKSEKVYATGVVTCALLVNEFAKERELSSLYITSNGGEYQQDLLNQITKVDNSLKSFRNSISKNGWSGDIIQIERALKLLPRIRSRVSRLGVPAGDAVNYYSNSIKEITNFMLTLSDSKSRMRMGLNAMVLLTVNAGLTRSIGSIVFAKESFTAAEYQSFIEYNANEQAFKAFLSPIVGSTIMNKYDDLLGESDAKYNQILQYALENRDNELNVDKNDWYDVTVDRGDKMLQMEQYIASLVTSNANSALSKSTTEIAIVCVAVFLIWLAAISTAYIFSRAITGPWKRLIKIQEGTIKKFVPKGFLRLLKCYRLADLSLGKSVQRDLTIMMADIRNFTQISEKMSPAQLFNFLNKYLAYVGPIIRRKGGYIDKFLGDRVIVCFPTMTIGVESSIAMQSAIEQLNRENPDGPQIRVGVGITCGSVMVGAIGENERMEGTIISDCVPVTARLESLTKPFGAKILTTAEAMKRLKNPKALKYRPLGYVKAKTRKGMIKVYEILDKNDKLKVDSSKKFKEAIDLMIKHEYDTAARILREVKINDPSDKAALKIHESCIGYYKRLVEAVDVLKVAEGLQIESVRDTFGDYCSLEKMDAQFSCWTTIHEYKNAVNDKERMQVMKKVNDQYLKQESPQKVNVDAQWQKRVETIFVDYHLQSKSPDPSLFNTLQQEVEGLMADSFDTFKKSPMFLDAYKRSLPTPVIAVTEEETL
jgi:class 3 adenylate cyclase